MKLALVRIGNSRGIRIPKPILEQCGIEDTVNLVVERDRLVIAPVPSPREGWDEAFKAAASSGSDELLLDGAGPNEFDLKEWRW